MNLMEMPQNTEEKGTGNMDEGETAFIKKPEETIAAMGVAELAKFKAENEAALEQVRAKLNSLYEGTVENGKQTEEEIGLRIDAKALDEKDILASAQLEKLTQPKVGPDPDDETVVMTREQAEKTAVEIKQNPFA